VGIIGYRKKKKQFNRLAGGVQVFLLLDFLIKKTTF